MRRAFKQIYISVCVYIYECRLLKKCQILVHSLSTAAVSLLDHGEGTVLL